MKYVFCFVALLFVACNGNSTRSTFPWIPTPTVSDAGVKNKADVDLDAYSQDQ